MKSLAQLVTDNRMSNRDYGGLCNWAVFDNGDFVAQFLSGRGRQGVRLTVRIRARAGRGRHRSQP
jgi:hypothetical protein